MSASPPEEPLASHASAAPIEEALAFDATVISRFFLDDREFYTGARDLFLQSAERGLEDLASRIESTDREGLRRLVHRLRSSAATVGAARFAHLCQLAEALDESSPLPTAWLQELSRSHHEFVEQSRLEKDVGSAL